MLEKKLQQKIIDFCSKRDILAKKVDSTSSRGWPDLIVVLRNGVVLFVELKTPKGRLSALQERTIKQLKENNANVYVIRSVDSFIETCKRYDADL